MKRIRKILLAALVILMIYAAWLADERANRTEAYAKACAQAGEGGRA